MKVTILILCLGLFLIVGFQGCIAGAGGAVFGEAGAEDAGAIGVFLSFLYFVGAAFALFKPLVTAIILGFGGLIAVITGGEHYGDLPIWGVIALIIGAMSYYVHVKEKKNKEVEEEKDVS